MTADLRVPRALLETPDDAELAWRVTEPAFAATNVYDGPAALAADLARLSAGQRALLALHWCVSEVSNGGFDQFLMNPSGLLADEAVAGFGRIGAAESLGVLRQAIAIAADRPAELDADDPASDEADHAAAFDAYLARHQPLEERFFDLVELELYPRAAEYVRLHPAEFVR